MDLTAGTPVVTVALQVLATFLLLGVPGLVLGGALGLRGWRLLGAAPVMTVGAAGVLGAWFGLVGIPWSPLSATIGLLLLAALALTVVRRLWRREAWRREAWRWDARRWDEAGRRDAGRRPARRGNGRPGATPTAGGFAWYHHVAIAAALSVACALGAVVVAHGSYGLRGIPQYWDAMFHANAIRFIADTRNANSSALSAIAQPANPHFYYPHTFHLFGALLFQSGLQPVQVVLNAMSACLPGVFALSLVGLLRVVTPRPTTLCLGAVAAATFASFPYDLINFGPLLPLALAIAVSPAVIALLLALVRTPSAGLAAGLAIGIVGMLTTHPSAAVAAAMMMAFAVLFGRREDQVWRDRRRLLVVAGAAVTAVVLALPSLTGLLGPAGQATAVHWPTAGAPGTEFGQLALLNHDSAYPQWWLVIPIVLGAVLALRDRALRPFLISAATFLALFVLAASYDTRLAALATAIWWNDRWRLAALYVVPAAVLAAAGFTWLVDRVRFLAGRAAQLLGGLRGRLTAPSRVVPRWAVRALPVVLVAAAFLVLSSGGYASNNVGRVHYPYTVRQTVTPGEVAAYAQLARLWHGGSVLNDPSDGSAWAYGLDGLPMVFKTPLTPPVDPASFGADRNTLLAHFGEGVDDPQVAKALDDLDVRWVIVGDGFASPTVGRVAGLAHLDSTTGVHLVWSNDVAKIYSVDRDAR